MNPLFSLPAPHPRPAARPANVRLSGHPEGPREHPRRPAAGESTSRGGINLMENPCSLNSISDCSSSSPNLRGTCSSVSRTRTATTSSRSASSASTRSTSSSSSNPSRGRSVSLANFHPAQLQLPPRCMQSYLRVFEVDASV